MTMAAAAGAAPSRPMTREERKVIIASSVGTVFEWYDFYLAGSLAANISATFFSGVNPTAAFIFTLLGFAAGFAVRPFGALFFGSLGDLIGRKYTFLVTMTLMGIATFVVGLLPGYASIGIAAPVLFIACRLLQGLALGGEYGGAATYVAEHAPQHRRGFYTSWIQTTATVGLFLSLLVILGLRALDVARAVRRVGLAHPVPAVDHPARCVDLDPPAARGVAGLCPHQGGRQELQDAAARGLRPVGERQDRALRPARRHRRPGGGVVHGPVLRPVLPHPDAEARCHDVQHRDRRVARDRHAVLHLLRLAVGQDRPQADHPGGLPARGRHLLPAVPCAQQRGQPAARAGDQDRAGDGGGRSQRVLVPVQPDGHGKLHHVVRPRQVVPRAQRGELQERGRHPRARRRRSRSATRSSPPSTRRRREPTAPPRSAPSRRKPPRPSARRAIRPRPTRPRSTCRWSSPS